MAKSAVKLGGSRNWLEDARRAAASEFGRLPDPNFKYGLAVRFDPSRILLPYRDGEPEVEKPRVSATGNAEIRALNAVLRNKSLRDSLNSRLPTSSSQRAWSWFDSQPWSGLIVRIPAGAKATVSMNFDGTARPSAHRTVILAEKGSEATIMERVSGRGAARRRVRMDSIEIIGRPGSAVRFVRLQELPPSADEFFRIRAALEASAGLEMFECVFGGAFCQSLKGIRLAGKGSSVSGRCVFFAGKNQSFDIAEAVRHEAGRTSCDLVERGVVSTDGHAALRPLISIPRGANGCSGRQKGDIIILGPRAEADAAPHLEIGAGDAACAHSAAIGRLNPEQVFHLRGKGIGPDDAARLLVRGFLEPMMDAARKSNLDGTVERLVEEKFKRLI